MLHPTAIKFLVSALSRRVETRDDALSTHTTAPVDWYVSWGHAENNRELQVQSTAAGVSCSLQCMSPCNADLSRGARLFWALRMVVARHACTACCSALTFLFPERGWVLFDIDYIHVHNQPQYLLDSSS